MLQVTLCHRCFGLQLMTPTALLHAAQGQVREALPQGPSHEWFVSTCRHTVHPHIFNLQHNEKSPEVTCEPSSGEEDGRWRRQGRHCGCLHHLRMLCASIFPSFPEATLATRPWLGHVPSFPEAPWRTREGQECHLPKAPEP